MFCQSFDKKRQIRILSFIGKLIILLIIIKVLMSISRIKLTVKSKYEVMKPLP